MLFWLKKFTTFWLLPLPLSLTLLAIGLFFLWRNKRARLGFSCAFLGFLWLFLCGNKAFSRLLMRPLETCYPPIAEFSPGQSPAAPLSGCRYIVILGGGHSEMEGLSALNMLSSNSASRVTEGVRLALALPDTTLLISGPSDSSDAESHASIQTRAVQSLGIPQKRIRLIDTARDTEDEAREVAKIAGSSRIALVTSAWHMPRATALFRKQGVDIVPCPADYMAKFSRHFYWSDYNWDAESIVRSTYAVREYMGLLWSKLRGKT